MMILLSSYAGCRLFLPFVIDGLVGRHVEGCEIESVACGTRFGTIAMKV